MRYLKALGLTLVAVLATGAIAASAASANQFHSTVTNTTSTVASNETQAFKYEAAGRTVECTKVGGQGEGTAQTRTEVTFKPTYSGCTMNGISGSSAEISMNECDNRLTIEAAANEGPMHVACPAGKEITSTVKVIGISLCTLHIGKQTPSGKSKYVNNGTKQVKVQPNQTGIVASRQGSAECGAATSTTGSYTGSVVVKGEKTGTQEEAAIQVG